MQCAIKKEFIQKYFFSLEKGIIYVLQCIRTARFASRQFFNGVWTKQTLVVWIYFTLVIPHRKMEMAPTKWHQVIHTRVIQAAASQFNCVARLFNLRCVVCWRCNRTLEFKTEVFISLNQELLLLRIVILTIYSKHKENSKHKFVLNQKTKCLRSLSVFNEIMTQDSNPSTVHACKLVHASHFHAFPPFSWNHECSYSKIKSCALSCAPFSIKYFIYNE